MCILYIYTHIYAAWCAYTGTPLTATGKKGLQWRNELPTTAAAVVAAPLFVYHITRREE